jgi:hypothetical protein
MNHKENAEDEGDNHGDGEDAAEEKAGNPDQETNVARPSEGKLWPIIRLVSVMLGEVGVVLWIISEHFLNASSPLIAGILLFFAVVSLTAYGVHNVVKSSDFDKYRNHTKALWNGYWLWCLVLLVIFAVTLWPKPKPRPHLTLLLATSDSPDFDLMFTNDFLFVERYDPHKKFVFPEGAAFLIIRVPSGHTNVTLKFGLLNDSAAQWEVVDDSALTVDVPMLELATKGSEPSGTLKWSAAPPWRQSRSGDGGYLLHFDMPHPLLPGRGEWTPEIIFETPADFSEKMSMFATIRGKGVPRIGLLFNLLFIRSQGIIHPCFVNGNITVVKLPIWPKNEGRISN